MTAARVPVIAPPAVGAPVNTGLIPDALHVLEENGGGGDAPAKVSAKRLLGRAKPQLAAHHLGVADVPAGQADCAPLPVVGNLQAALVRCAALDQMQLYGTTARG